MRSRRKKEETRCHQPWKWPLIIGAVISVLAFNARFLQWEARFLETTLVQGQQAHPQKIKDTSVYAEEDPTIMGIFPPELRPLDPENNPRDRCLVSIRQRHEELLRKYVDQADHILYLDPSYHDNVGDTMLTMGILKFFAKSRAKVTQCVYTQSGDYLRLKCDDAIAKLAKEFKNQTVLAVWHAGGNWGDLYPHVHRPRINSVDKILKAGFKLLAMPSSYHYSKPNVESSLNSRLKSFVLNNNAQDRVVLTWREQGSYEKALQEYPFATNLLVPDIAFQLGPYKMDAKSEHDLLAFLRQDRESTVDRAGVQAIVDKTEPSLSFTVADWPARYELFGSTDYLDLKTAIQLLALGRVTVADRLHASVLAFLGDRPLVYVDQITGKLNKTLSVALSSEGCMGGGDLRVSKAVGLPDAVAQVAEMLDQQKKLSNEKE